MKAFRTIALTAVITLAAVPAMHANQTGANPHPQVVTASSSFMSYVQAVLALFGA